jgi:Uma2 family endonuclease
VARMALSQITWQDVQQLPDDGNRYEAIAGELYVTPEPSLQHQRISRKLLLALQKLIGDPGLGELFYAPVGVEFPATEEGVQPDLVFVSSRRRGILADPWIRGAPDLVIEILSPTTAHRDQGVKRKLYERQGVAQYWIVDPVAAAVEVWAYGGEPGFERFTESLPMRLGRETHGEIDLAEIFRGD